MLIAESSTTETCNILYVQNLLQKWQLRPESDVPCRLGRSDQNSL